MTATDGLSSMIDTTSPIRPVPAPHPFLIHEEGFKARYLRLTVEQMPFDQPACVSGIRVFGHGPEDEVEPDSVQGVSVTRDSAMDMTVSWSHDDAAVGHNVLWGHAPDKLYHSRMVFDADSQSIGALDRWAAGVCPR
ncbi:MAG: hypothetical protein ACLRYR_12460 [Bifidobacterium dentium]